MKPLKDCQLNSNEQMALVAANFKVDEICESEKAKYVIHKLNLLYWHLTHTLPATNFIIVCTALCFDYHNKTAVNWNVLALSSDNIYKSNRLLRLVKCMLKSKIFKLTILYFNLKDKNKDIILHWTIVKITF